jgi:hypothetical protein
MTVPSSTGTATAPEHDRPPWWALSILISLAVLLVILYGYSVSSARLLFLELLVAVAAFSAGSLIGFLFGLPKAGLLRNGTGDGGEAVDEPERERAGYQPSTNLEQISDWLTKILIGVGLVELRELGSGLDQIGQAVAKSIGSGTGSAVLTQIVLVCFLIVGFLVSYLWTRLHYGGIQTRTDLGILRQLAARTRGLEQKTAGLAHKVEEQTSLTEGLKKTTHALARGEIIPSGQAEAGPRPSAVPVAAPQREDFSRIWPPDVLKSFDTLLAAPTNWDADDVVVHFGSRPSTANGRSLTGEVIADLDGGLAIRLIVKRDEGPPLSGDVVFLLHSTFRDRAVRAPVRNDRAETTVYSEGWFTAGAILDEGRTVLTYDLRRLPNVPRWFKEEE